MGDPELVRAVALCERGRWVDAREVLVAFQGALAPEDQERLAVSAAMTGQDDLACAAWERAHLAWRDRGDAPRAVRAAMWLGLLLVTRGEMARASGWFSRASRVLDDAGIACAETGRVLVPEALQLLHRDPARSLELFRRVLECGVEYGDDEVAALGCLGSGQARVQLGDAAAATRLFDEAMVLVTTTDVCPIAVGLVYCAVILECHRIFDLPRAQEWTRELDRWSGAQQGLVPFRGQCLVHRSEMAQMRGDWDAAVEEADLACAHLSDPAADPVLGLAMYQRAELHRLRGEFDLAEAAYDHAAALGRRDVPGRPLLLWQRGDLDAASAAIRMAASEATGPVQEARVLAALVEIVLAGDDVAAARDAAARLQVVAEEFGTPMLAAVAARARAQALLADGDPEGAVEHARKARDGWQRLGVPHEVARAQAVLADGYERLGDSVDAESCRRAARRVFEELGAVVDLRRLQPRGTLPGSAGGLSPREVEVIRLVAGGRTNREIAGALVISERTAERHVSNILTKLGVRTRTAASAWAWERGLVGR